jgi:hypothetical protein
MTPSRHAAKKDEAAQHGFNFNAPNFAQCGAAQVS